MMPPHGMMNMNAGINRTGGMPPSGANHPVQPNGSGPRPMMPPKPQQMGPRPMMPPKPAMGAPGNAANGNEDPFATNPQQRMFYQNLFIQLDKDKDRKISHDDVIAYHAQSGLPKEVLEKLYAMSDLDRDGYLDFAEFVIMTHILFTCRRGIPLPDKLPASLIPPSTAGLVKSVEPEVEEE